MEGEKTRFRTTTLTRTGFVKFIVAKNPGIKFEICFENTLTERTGRLFRSGAWAFFSVTFE